MKNTIVLILSLICSACSVDEYIGEINEEKTYPNQNTIVTDTIYEVITEIPYTSDNLDVYVHSINGDSNSEQIAANDVLFIESKNNRKIKSVDTTMEFSKCLQLTHTSEKRVYWFADTVKIRPITITLTFTYEV